MVEGKRLIFISLKLNTKKSTNPVLQWTEPYSAIASLGLCRPKFFFAAH
jgi:hypothetical protein